MPYSSMQMVQRWSSFDSTPRPTLGRRARNASAMMVAMVRARIEIRGRRLLKGVGVGSERVTQGWRCED